MKYKRVQQRSGNLILAKFAVTNEEDTRCTLATAEHEDEPLPDYISQSREYHFLPPNQSEPTQAQPGTKEKLQVMTERYRSGQPLHDPGDTACLDRRYFTRIYYQVLDQKTTI